jgi:hypothetical protein
MLSVDLRRDLRPCCHGERGGAIGGVVAAHVAAQLPELLRGVFYDGWNPSKVPVKKGQ